MSTLNGQWLEIFRAGNYGDKGVFTVPQLTALAASYDPAKSEAPICIGHPKMDAPAFGWVKKLKVEGDTLLALPGEVQPAFDNAVKSGAYKKRSVAFLRDKESGALTLRHLGYLGAMPPGVEGLRDAQFSADVYDEIDFSEGEEMDETQVKKTVASAITEFFANLGGKRTESASTLSQADIDAAAQNAVAALRTEFAAQLQAEKDARTAIETQFADHKKSIGSVSATARATSLVDGLKAAKHWIPAYDKLGVPALFASLANAPVEIEFAQGETTVKKDSAQLLADVLSGIGKIVPDGVLFSGSPDGEKTATAPSTNGAVVDGASVTFNEQVAAYAKEQKIEFVDAYRELVKQGKRPESGSSSAGAV